MCVCVRLCSNQMEFIRDKFKQCLADDTKHEIDFCATKITRKKYVDKTTQNTSGTSIQFSHRLKIKFKSKIIENIKSYLARSNPK